MKRREFLNVTVGATVITPLATSASEQGVIHIDPPPDLTPNPVVAGGRWFMNEPTRIGWFTLRYSDTAQSAEAFVAQASEARMNLILLTVGGSFAFYPSAIPFHQWAPHISKSNDFLGKIVSEAKSKNIRIGARFDFSKQSAESVKANPEWFFTFADGSHPVDASGRTPPCINGDFFRKQAILIMKEVITRYKPALIYLNNFGNNLGGQNLPDPCQCKNCKRLFLQKTGKPLPRKMTSEVRVFLKHCAYDTGLLFYKEIEQSAPDTIFINADTTPTHGWHSEARMVIAPSDVWLYISSEAVNRQKTSFPESVTCNNITSYSSNASRLALMPAPESRLRLFQAMAQGSPPTYVVTGTMEQDDKRDLEAARQAFNWHATNEDIFGDTINPAKVLLLVQPEHAPRGRNIVIQQSMRGIYSILTENHIPVVVSETVDTIQKDPKRFDLVIVTPGAKDENGILEEFVKSGGRILFVGEEPSFAIPARVKKHELTRVAYIEVRDDKKFPSLTGFKYLMGTSMCPYNVIDIFSAAEMKSMTFIEYPEDKDAILTYVPPMIENPSEVSQSDLKHTTIPALLKRDHGKGRIAYLPWDLGALYNRLAIQSHANLLTDLVDQLLPSGRQLQSDAHSSVEMILQQKSGRLILHLINLSGQTQNYYMEAVTMGPINISIAGQFNTAKVRNINAAITVTHSKDRTAFTLPSLGEYEVIVLE